VTFNFGQSVDITVATLCYERDAMQCNGLL